MIYEHVRQSLGRPQSAVPTGGDPKKMVSARDNSPTQTAMRSSFYSMSLLNESEKAELENCGDQNQVSAQFKEQQV